MYVTEPPPIIDTYTEYSSGRPKHVVNEQNLDAFRRWAAETNRNLTHEVTVLSNRVVELTDEYRNLKAMFQEQVRFMEFVGKQHGNVIHEYLAVKKVNTAFDKAMSQSDGGPVTAGAP